MSKELTDIIEHERSEADQKLDAALNDSLPDYERLINYDCPL